MPDNEDKKEEQKTTKAISPWMHLTLHQQTGRVIIKSNLDHWWRAVHMLVLALHGASDLNVKEMVEDEKKVLVVPTMGGLKGVKS